MMYDFNITEHDQTTLPSGVIWADCPKEHAVTHCRSWNFGLMLMY